MVCRFATLQGRKGSEVAPCGSATLLLCSQLLHFVDVKQFQRTGLWFEAPDSGTKKPRITSLEAWPLTSGFCIVERIVWFASQSSGNVHNSEDGSLILATVLSEFYLVRRSCTAPARNSSRMRGVIERIRHDGGRHAVQGSVSSDSNGCGFSCVR